MLVDAAGEVKMRYRGLAAFDATGRELEALLLPSPNGVGVRIDDRHAIDPLRIDPILSVARPRAHQPPTFPRDPLAP